jgi:energy-coupling factor transporter ATP-binding protein EcfA2
MFRFLDVSLHGWALWPDLRLPLDRDVVLVMGPNGSGKTTLLDAIRQVLGAPKLSSRRRLAHYLRRPDAPALVAARVTNDAPDGGEPPFARERIRTPEATLACAILPGTAGVPEKRYAILPGQPSVAELRRILLESREFLPPERYARALAQAGVSRSLMGVLAIEQGRTNQLFELRPRELFTRVLEMLGEQPVLDRYRDARRRFEDARAELTRQLDGVQHLNAELHRVQRLVRQLDDWEAAKAKVDELEARLPAAEFQEAWHRRQELGPKLAELRTKVRIGEATLAKHRSDALAARRALDEADVRQAKALETESASAEERVAAETALGLARDRLQRAEDAARRAAELPEAEPGALEQRAQGARTDEAAASHAFGLADRALAAAREEVDRRARGLPVHAHEVLATLEALDAAQIDWSLLADLIEPRDSETAEALEAALGDARFSLLVSGADVYVAAALAREQRFPGPVYGGPREAAATAIDDAVLAPGAPAWLGAWRAAVVLGSDGTWEDARGRWTSPPRGRFLGAEGAKAALAEAERRLAAADEAQRKDAVRAEAASSLRRAAEAALEQARERQRLLEAAADRAEAVAALDRANAGAAERRAAWTAAREARERAADERTTARLALGKAEEALQRFESQLAGERESLAVHELETVEVDRRIETLERDVRSDLLARARGRELDGPDTVRADAGRAREQLARLPEPPGLEVRDEERHLRANLEEAERHVTERRREADGCESELGECRRRYIDLLGISMREYRARAVDLGRRADVAVEMDLPRLEDDDRVLDEAEIRARFGFDGKDPLPPGDPSFSGGQQVIVGLVLLMAMAETDGRGFFMLDEPFAHLSLDRIDDVSRFLRTTRCQFLLTAPTTLDRAQLDPAALVIVTMKRRAGEPLAPIPIVAVA